MATWEDVRRIALALPQTDEWSTGKCPRWRVQEKGFAWERPLRHADLIALGADAPSGPILGARVEHDGAKEALLSENPAVYFTTPHFDGYPAVLVCLDRISVVDLENVIVDAWLARAPERLAQAYIDAGPDRTA